MDSPPDTPRVLLTGATGGLGPVIADALARTGAALALSALPEPGLDALAERLAGKRVARGADSGTPERAAVVALPEDLRDPGAPGRLVDAATDALGGIDVLVHSAGIERVGHYELRTRESLEDVVRVNLLSAMELTRLVVPPMLERGWGRLVFVSSLSARAAPPFTAAYTASKAGLAGLARSLRAEYRETGIRASVVLPGFVAETGMYARGRREAGFRPSRVLGTVRADQVARAVVRALERDPPEVLIQRGPTRLALALAELFPRLVGEHLNRWVGSDRIFQRWADVRARTSPPGPAAGPQSPGHSQSPGPHPGEEPGP